MTPEHTPLSWGIDEFDKTKIRSEVNVCAMTNCVARVTTPKDAAFIVEACNSYEAIKKSHAELLKLLKENLIRMRLINTNCVHDDLMDCPNHNLMNITEKAIELLEGL